MDKLAIWVLVGILGYISFVLTSIDSKIDALDMHNTQYAMLNETKSHSYSADDVKQIVYQEAIPMQATPLQTGFLIAALISIFASWHLSRIYHTNRWTKRILNRSFTHFADPPVFPTKREAIHLDQDCVTDAPRPDGRIKDSWLPPHVKKLYAGWSRQSSFDG